MPECTIILSRPIWSALYSLFERHVAAVGILVLTLIFLSGLFEILILKQRGVARATWFWGLTVLSLWVGVPFTKLRILAAVAVFVAGLALLVTFGKSTPGHKEHGKGGG